MVDVKSKLGECPIWDESRKLLLWIDIFGLKLMILSIESGKLEIIELPEQPGSLALCKSGVRILLAL